MAWRRPGASHYLNQWWLDYWFLVSLVKFLWCECYWALLVTSQHLFKQCLGAVSQSAIVWANVDQIYIYIYQMDCVCQSWSIEQRSSKYKCGTRRCDLCLSEKTIIAMAERSSLLNRRAEIVSTCNGRHRTKFRYHMVKKKRPVQALSP